MVRPGPGRKIVAEVAGGGIDPLPVGIQAPEHVDPIAAAGDRGAFPVKGREGVLLPGAMPGLPGHPGALRSGDAKGGGYKCPAMGEHGLCSIALTG